MSVTRLDFRLPEFVRTVWVSDQAREVWQPRMERLARVWPRIERVSVRAGLRLVAQMTVGQGEVEYMEREAAAYGLQCLGLEGEDGREELRELVMGGRADVERFAAAWMAGDHIEMGRLLGYPECCCQFYGEMAEGWADLVWPMVVNTGEKRARELDGLIYEIPAAGGGNVLLARLGVRMVAHRPCGLDCQQTKQLGERFVQLGREIGFREEIGWLTEILHWPMEWSMLHGIVEVKTPVFKLSMDGVATGEKVGVRVLGAGYPEEGGMGVGFPYRRPEQMKVSGSRGFARGMEKIVNGQ